jgi:hypothetical protein
VLQRALHDDAGSVANGRERISDSAFRSIVLDPVHVSSFAFKTRNVRGFVLVAALDHEVDQRILFSSRPFALFPDRGQLERRQVPATQEVGEVGGREPDPGISAIHVSTCVKLLGAALP